MSDPDSRLAVTFPWRSTVPHRPPSDVRWPGGQTLAAAFDPRRNSLAMMRLGLAGVVAVAHSLGVAYGDEPALGVTELGDVAVDGFFVLSGFLVTRSFGGLNSVGRFAWHRFLRLMPGFWVCLVVTALVLAPLAAALTGRDPWSVFTADEDPAWSYPLVNGLLPILQYEIAGITTSAGVDVFDGSLWTLQYEAFCYGVIAVLGAAAILQRRPWVLLVLVAVVWVGAVVQWAGLVPFDVPVLENGELLRFLLVFLLGAAGYVFADRVPVHWGLAVVSGGVVVGASFLPDYHLVAALAFAYLCLYGVVRLPLTWNPRWDLSYGLYVYHWPVELLLVLAGVTALGQWSYVVLSLVIALGLAALSWVFVEGPALRRKGVTWRGRRSPDRRTAP